MWRRWSVAVMVAIGLVVCGSAHADAPVTALTGDGYGVQLGSADAPARLEIFCEPQCPYCAKFEEASGIGLLDAVAAGRVEVTYRWLTFLDERRHNQASARLANALILAADPTTHPVAYQSFVNGLYRLPRSADGPTVEEIADTALAGGVLAPVADRIRAGETVVDTAALNAANSDRLDRANPEHPGTPTIYDPNTDQLVDTDQPDWLDRLGR